MQTSQLGMSIVEVLVAVSVISVMSLSVAYFSNTKTQASQTESLDAFNCQVQVNSVLSTLRGEGQSTWMLSYYPHLAFNNPAGVPANDPAVDYAVDVQQVWKGAPPTFMPPSFNEAGRKFILMDAATNPQLPPLVSMAHIQRSTVTLVEELYNTQPAFCTNVTGSTTPELDRIAQQFSYMARRPTDEDSARTVAQTKFRQDAETLFKITPYEVDSGKLLTNCPPNIASIPMGVDATQSTFDQTNNKAPNYVIARPKSADNLNIGYQVEITTTVTDKSSGDVVGRCSGTQRFEHQRDTLRPTMPVVRSVVKNTTFSNFSATVPHPSSGRRTGLEAEGQVHRNRVQIAFRLENVKRGSVVLCRDRSKVPTDPPVATNSFGICMGAAIANNGSATPTRLTPGPGPQRFKGDPGNAPAIKQATDTADLITLEDLGILDAKNRGWKPCDQVTVCGRKPISSQILRPGSATVLDDVTQVRAALALDASPKDGLIDEITFINTYDNLRTECVPNLQIATSDQSGNYGVSKLSVTDTAHQGLHKHHTEVNMPSSNPILEDVAGIAADLPYTEIARPTCGNYCTNVTNTTMDTLFPGYRAASPTGTQGYWQLGACCTTYPAHNAFGGKLALSKMPNQAALVQAYNRTYACQPGFSGALGADTSGTIRSHTDPDVAKFAYSHDMPEDGKPVPAIEKLDKNPVETVSEYMLSGARLPEAVIDVLISEHVSTEPPQGPEEGIFLPGGGFPLGGGPFGSGGMAPNTGDKNMFRSPSSPLGNQ